MSKILSAPIAKGYQWFFKLTFPAFLLIDTAYSCLNNLSRYEDCNSKVIPKAWDGKPIIQYSQTCQKRSSSRGISPY